MKRKVKLLIYLIIFIFVAITAYKYFYMSDNKIDDKKEEVIVKEKNEFEDIIGYAKDNLDKYKSYKLISSDLSNEEIVKRINEFSNIVGYSINNLDKYSNYKTINPDLSNEEIVKRINEFSDIDGYNINYLDRYSNYKLLNPNLTDLEIIKRINVYLDYKFYNHDMEAINKQSKLVLVNKYFYLGEDYVPNNLVLINSKYANGSNYGDAEAVDMFGKMCDEAKLNSLNIRAISVYRSFATQRAIYNNYLKNDNVASVDTYSARAGYSEHQTGLAFDVYNGRISYTAFGNTNEYKWINENSYKYGFIVRYKKETQYLTGYQYEPWHLRYVGIDAATYIYNNNITLEEYLLNKK